MDSNPWEAVIDELYEMGGYGEWCDSEDNAITDSDLDLLAQTELEANDLDSIADRLESSGLIRREQKFEPDGMEDNTVVGTTIFTVWLTEDGFGLAHDRRAEKRNHESNRAVVRLTFVLAVVGLSQATALTVQSDSIIATGILACATLIFVAVYIWLFRRGSLDF